MTQEKEEKKEVGKPKIAGLEGCEEQKKQPATHSKAQPHQPAKGFAGTYKVSTLNDPS